MIVYNHPQGSAEWLASRAGVITASMFSAARKKVNGLSSQQAAYVEAIRSGMTETESMLQAGYKAKPKAESIDRALRGESVGEFSDATKDYAFRLAVERISGTPLDEGFSTWAMKRGQELEPAARAEVEVALGVFVDEAGFVCTDDLKFGASADGFIDHDGGLEIKCLVDPSRIRDVIMKDDISDFMDQIQGGMWITGRKWWQFALYCPALEKVGLHLWTKRVERDDNYINAMELDLIEFEKLVTENETKLRNYHSKPADITPPWEREAA